MMVEQVVDESRVVELRVHPGHRGFLTGGRRGSVVVRVIGSQDSRVLVETDDSRDARILIKQGWSGRLHECHIRSEC